MHLREIKTAVARGKCEGFAVYGDMQLFSEDAVSDWLGRPDQVDEI